MFRILFIVFLVFASSISTAQNLADLQFGEQESLEIITWNMQEFPLSGQSTVDSLTKAIYALDADVYAFQEMFDTLALRNMVDAMDGYETFYQDPDFGGLAVVYKSESIDFIDQYEIFYTSQFWNYFPRAPVVMEFFFEQEFYVLINNHFKCCGDGDLDDGNEEDEEFRRQEASLLLEQFIEEVFPVENVFMVGDLNDMLTDPIEDNVFQGFIDNPEMTFADMDIAEGSSEFWSFPAWPSHIDHILVTNELFDELEDESASVQTLRIEDFLSGGLDAYYDLFSDHRPLAIKIFPASLSTVSHQEELPEFRLYPNPVSEEIILKRKTADRSQLIEVYDLKGERMVQKPFQKGKALSRIDVSDLSSGQYFLKIGNEVLRFVKVPGF